MSTGDTTREVLRGATVAVLRGAIVAVLRGATVAVLHGAITVIFSLVHLSNKNIFVIIHKYFFPFT